MYARREDLLLEFSQKAYRILETRIKIKLANTHHLSIAYGYNITDHASIVRIIRDKISLFRDGDTPKYHSNSSWNTSQWEIRLYQPPPENIKLSSTMNWEAICKLWVNHYKKNVKGHDS